ncbi:MAG: lasso peptide biosynthesis B2 protein [Acidobacteriota bacterium]
MTRWPDDAPVALVAQGAALLAAARVAVTLLPVPTVVAAMTRPAAHTAEGPSPSRVVSLVDGIARRLPWRPTCFERALVSAWLLVRRGRRGRIVVGVVPPGAARRLKGHAWLEGEGLPCPSAADEVLLTSWAFPAQLE